MEHADPATNPFGTRYWRCLYEFKVRNFRLAERRLLEKVNDLSYGRGQPDVAIANRHDLAEAIQSDKGTTQPVIESLLARDILGHEERLGTWWLKEIDLWRVGVGDQADPDRALRAAAAEARIVAHDLLRKQPELFPRETTDAEVAAEGQQAHAASWPVTAVSSAVTSPPSGASSTVEIGWFRRAKEQIRVGNFPTAVGKNPTPVGNFPTSVGNFPTESAPLYAGGASEPGNPVNTFQNLPGRPGGKMPAQLDHAGWSLLQDLEAFCVAGGDAPFSDKYRREWSWRVRKNPLWVEMCLRETMAHVREGRQPRIKTRVGWIKHLWSEEEKASAQPDSEEATHP